MLNTRQLMMTIVLKRLTAALPAESIENNKRAIEMVAENIVTDMANVMTILIEHHETESIAPKQKNIKGLAA